MGATRKDLTILQVVGSHMRDRVVHLLLLAMLCTPTGFAALMDGPNRDRMGFSVCFEQEQSRLDVAHDCGDWLRIQCMWEFIEASHPNNQPHNYKWIADVNNPDDNPNNYPGDWVAAAPNRQNIVLCIGTTPYLARPSVYNNVGDYDAGSSGYIYARDVAPALANEQDWSDFCSAVAAHFGPLGVHYYEIWNEPNHEWMYASAYNQSIEYPELLRLASNAIKAVDNSAKIITGGISSCSYSRRWTWDPTDINVIPSNLAPARNYHTSAREWLIDLYSHTFTEPDDPEQQVFPMSHYFDFIGYHPYPPIVCNEDNWGGPAYQYDDADYLRYSFVQAIYDSIMCPNGDSSKQIWGTECGLDSPHGHNHHGGQTPDRACPSVGEESKIIQASWVNEFYSRWNDWRAFTGPLMWFQCYDDEQETPQWTYGFMHGNKRDPADPTIIIDADSLKPSYNEFLNCANGKVEYHLGEAPDQYSYNYWTIDYNENGISDLTEAIKRSAQFADTISIYLHGQNYYRDGGIFSDLDLRDIPSSYPFICLKIIGVSTGNKYLINLGSKPIILGNQSLIMENIEFNGCYSATLLPFISSSGDINLVNCDFVDNQGRVIIDSGENGGGKICIKNCQFIDNTATYGNNTIDNSMINSIFEMKISDCVFSNNQFPRGVIKGATASDGQYTPMDPPVVLIENTIFSHNNNNNVAGRSILQPWASLSLRKCTFDSNEPSSSEIHLRSGTATILSTIFKSTGAGNRNVITKSIPYSSTPTVHNCLFNQETWAQTFLATADTSGNFIVNHAESDSKIGFVNPSGLDYRLRWDNVGMDQGDPDSLDFDLTTQDIGWSPKYQVTEISGNVSIQEPGWYKLAGNTTLTSGTEQDLVIPEGTTIRCDDPDAYELIIQDTNSNNGYRITMGSLTGARTALVESEAGYLFIGSLTSPPNPTTLTTNGVLFNRGPDWCTGGGFVWFSSCLVDLDGQDGRTKFNDYNHTYVIFDNISGGIVHNFDFTAEQVKPPSIGIGQFDVFGSSIVIDNVNFNVISDHICDFDRKLIFGFSDPNGVGNVVSNCQFNDNETSPGKSPISLYNCNFYLHHNVFPDVRDASIDMSCCTARMNNIASNSFSRTVTSNTFNSKPIIHNYLSYLDLYCGNNSFSDIHYGNQTIFVQASTGTTDWSSNYWGLDCENPRNPIGHIPTFVTNVSPTLSECPTEVFEDPCNSQQSQSALYSAAKTASTNGNYSAAISYWNELLLSYPNSVNTMEACNAMKAIGVLTEFGADNYSAIASMLDTIAVVSRPLNASLSLHEFCNRLCVEGRHGDRIAVIASFDSLLVVFAKDKDEVKDIQIAEAEVRNYPEQGQSNSLSNQYATLARRRLGIRNLLNVMGGVDADSAEAHLQATIASQPASFEIRSIHPNPFNPSTTLDLELSREAVLRVEVFNLLGQHVATVHDGPTSAGMTRLAIKGTQWASGVYFVRVQLDKQTETRKILLAR